MKKILISSVLCLILLSVQVFAWGISYDRTNYEMEPGETRKIILSVQNYAEEKEFNIKTDIYGDSEVVKLEDNAVFSLPEKSKYAVPLLISIPRNAKDQYDFTVTFSALNNLNDISEINSKRSLKLTINVTGSKNNISGNLLYESNSIISRILLHLFSIYGLL